MLNLFDMKRIALLIGLALTVSSVWSQSNKELKAITPDKEFDNILVKKLSSDKHASAFIIWVEYVVREHKHETHSENLYVLEGKGKFTLGEETMMLKKGDYVFIPENTVHGVEVKSRKPMKVLSIQSPEFLGEDRIFMDIPR